MIRILVVEDDQNLNMTVCRHLSNHGYLVRGCHSAQEAIDSLAAEPYDLVISDIMMPGMDGFDLARNIRAQNETLPIIFMTARGDFTSKERGFRLGIDDYMTKPIDLDELLLRITAILRRASISANKKLVVGNLVLDEDEMSATVDGQPVALTLREFQILYKLLSYPGKTFTRGQLLDEFSGYESDSGLRSVDVHITHIRTKLAEATGFQIKPVRGLGYKAVIL